jgi:hypothetical protein
MPNYLVRYELKYDGKSSRVDIKKLPVKKRTIFKENDLVATAWARENCPMEWLRKRSEDFHIEIWVEDALRERPRE